MTVESGDFDDEHDGLDPPDDAPTRPWLPPDDRLWRHPSELSSVGPAPTHSRKRAARRRRLARSRPWALVTLGGVVGAVLAAGVATGTNWLSPARTSGHAGLTVTTASARIGPATGAQPVNSRPTVSTGPSLMGVVAKVWPSLVTVDVTTGKGHVRGSGLVFRSDGMVLTVARLLAGAAGISVISSNGRQDPASVVGEDADTGVAVIRVGRQLPSLTLGQAPPAAAGQMAIAVGGNGPTGSSPPVAIGTIREVNRQVRVDSGPPLLDAIDTDAPAGSAPGVALLDESGRVMGITTAATQEGGVAHWLAAPDALASDAANQLASTGKVMHAWLGVSAAENESGSPARGVPSGVEVLTVQSGSPAAAAGLKPEDVIESVNGQPVPSILDLQGVLRLHRPGTAVTLDVMRNGGHQPMEATLGSAA